MHPTPILATFSNISGRPKDMRFFNGCKNSFQIKNCDIYIHIFSFAKI